MSEENAFLEKIKNSIQIYEKNLIRKVIDEFNFQDDKEGLTENEFNQIFSNLPTSYRKRLNDKDKYFKSYAGMNTEMNYNEFNRMVDNLAEQEAVAGGSA